MKHLYALSKYDFQHGGEVDITCQYPPSNPRYLPSLRGRVSIRGNDRGYQVYVHWFGEKGPAGKDVEEILFPFSSGECESLEMTCKFASELNDREMRRMFKDIKDSEITEFIAVPDEVADDLYAKRHSVLDIKKFWEFEMRKQLA